MKRFFFFAAIFCFLLPSCNRTNSADPNPASLDGKWRMIMVTENISGTSFTKPSSIQGDVDIHFTSVRRIFNGNTPTNNIGENPYSTGTNQSLAIPVLNMTKVAETSWGNEFVDNIRSSQSYSFETDGSLNIKTINKTLKFRKL